jgi:hypothetical protein
MCERDGGLSAFGGKADMTICGMSAFAVAIGGKADIPQVQKRSGIRFWPSGVLHRGLPGQVRESFFLLSLQRL